MFNRLSPTVRRYHPLHLVRRARIALGNWRRRRVKDFDYVTFMLPEALPLLPAARGWLRRRLQGPAPISLWEMDAIFERIADDPRPKGIVLHLRGLRLSLADLQTLRNSLQRLQARGKRIVCFAQEYNITLYYIASVCDEILLQPGGELSVTGLRSQALFLKDTLALFGVVMDGVAISPFKGAMDMFTRDAISPEGQQQVDWLLDSRYEQIVSDIATGRKMTPEAVRAMIDGAPYLDEDALAAGYIDGVLTEEGLPARLGAKHFITWTRAQRILMERWRAPQETYVAVLPVSGLMIPGESGGPPGGIPLPIPFIGGERAGDLTVVRQVRGLMKDKRAAAVVLVVDSGGGASSAAEAMTSALAELAKDRPLVVYMNSAAASGGYYISTPARWIVAQPGTITGSIGVLRFKPVIGGVYEKVRGHVVEFGRGTNSNIFSDAAPFTDEQRAWIRRSVEHIYKQFVEHVARGRSLTPEAVDAVGGGRVWTGAQAKEFGLVDELGDLQAALKKARELANLPADAPAHVVIGKGKPLPPQLAEAVNPAASVQYALENVRALSGIT
ncbi:MAG: S49 family peptidase, partial [Burkholderiales bacterium]|nr:S49 family peptidase [Anaerolineae bacterium]